MHAPHTLEEALRLRAEHPGARPIAGGTDLMVALNAERERPDALIDLGRVEELRGWRREGDELVLGAGAHLHAGRGRRARLRAARARRRLAHGRIAADPQPRHDRRQSRHGLARGGRTAAAADRGRAHRARQQPRAAHAAARGLPARAQAQRAARTTSWSSPSASAPPRAPQTFMKVGPRNAMVISICSLALSADRERGELRAAFGSAGARRAPRHRSARRGRELRRARDGRAPPRSTTCAAPPPIAATRSAC